MVAGLIPADIQPIIAPYLILSLGAMTPHSQLFLDAVRQHEAGNISSAERLYQKVLNKEPRNADAWYLSGHIAIQRNKLTSALYHLDKAVVLRPAFKDALHNRGNVLLELGRDAEAADSFLAATRCAPVAVESFTGFGMALARLCRFAEAETAFTTALAQAPDHLAARAGLAKTLRQLGRDDEALHHLLIYAQAGADAELLRQVADEAMRRSLPATAIPALQALAVHVPQDGGILGLLAKLFCSGGLYSEAEATARRAVSLAPGLGSAHFTLGQALFRLGRLEEAATALSEACRCDPENAEARHFLSLITGRSEVEAQNSYIRTLFDSCADTFDRILVDELGYSAPWVLGEELVAAGALTRPSSIIDLGCGTGLCGTVLKPYAHRLDGVDLSPRMIDACRSRGIYDDLAEGDLVAFLGGRQACYDLAIAADVLIYVGESAPVFAAVRQALRPSGWFAFSIEVSEKAPVIGLSSGRFAHSVQYICDLATRYGFSIVSQKTINLRQESGVPIAGLAYVLQTA